MRDAVFFGHFDEVHRVAGEAIKRIPSDQLDFRPTEEMMSIRELCFHMYAQEKVLVSGCSEGRIEEKDFAEIDNEIVELDSVDDLVRYGEEVHRATNEWVRSASDEEYNKAVKTFFGEVTPFLLISGAMEHMLHHRGQLYTYLRILKIEPPDVFGPMGGE